MANTLPEALTQIRAIAAAVTGVRAVEASEPQSFVNAKTTGAIVYVSEIVSSLERESFGGGLNSDRYTVTLRGVLSINHADTADTTAYALVDALVAAFRVKDTLNGVVFDCVLAATRIGYLSVGTEGGPPEVYRRVEVDLAVWLAK